MWMDLYVLVWPLITLLVMLMLLLAIVRDVHRAKRDGEDMV